MRHPLLRRCVALWLAGAATLTVSQSRLASQEGSRFRTGVELVNVTATVTDRSGRFVPGLQQSDFLVFEDERPVEVAHFSAERVPVSLGILLDTSGSMAGDKVANARAAIERFLDRLEPEDEIFLYGFASGVELLQNWTTNRETARAAVRRVRAGGGTAMYDAVVEAVPLAQSGRNRKKAVVLISDGNDTNSRTDMRDVHQVVSETEVLIYAVGIDGQGEPTIRLRPPSNPPMPIPFPVPGLPGRRRPRFPELLAPQFPPRMGRRGPVGGPLNVAALREITDDSGGRTEVVRNSRDLDPATASIADELSRQYYLGYTSPGHQDGKWHSIRVEVRDSSLRVRARRGYMAGGVLSP
jgi:Ca-activated chloride channel homolog